MVVIPGGWGAESGVDLAGGIDYMKRVVSREASMRIASRGWVVLIIGVAFVVGVTAAAQQGPAARASGEDDLALAFEQEAGLTPQEQLGWADEKYTTVVQTREYAARLLTAARQADRPDIVKINCLNNKLMEINAQVQSFEERRNSLREAIRLNDNDRRMHEYRVLVVVYQKVQSLRMEVEACIGEEMGYVGAPAVTVVRDPNLTPFDFTTVEVPEPLLDRPPHASGFY